MRTYVQINERQPKAGCAKTGLVRRHLEMAINVTFCTRLNAVVSHVTYLEVGRILDKNSAGTRKDAEQPELCAFLQIAGAMKGESTYHNL